MFMSDFLLSKNKKKLSTSIIVNHVNVTYNSLIRKFTISVLVDMAMVVIRMKLMKLLVLVVVGATVQKCQYRPLFISL
jgi:hypothetical protein